MCVVTKISETVKWFIFNIYLLLFSVERTKSPWTTSEWFNWWISYLPQFEGDNSSLHYSDANTMPGKVKFRNVLPDGETWLLQQSYPAGSGCCQDSHRPSPEQLGHQALWPNISSSCRSWEQTFISSTQILCTQQSTHNT